MKEPSKEEIKKGLVRKGDELPGIERQKASCDKAVNHIKFAVIRNRGDFHLSNLQCHPGKHLSREGCHNCYQSVFLNRTNWPFPLLRLANRRRSTKLIYFMKIGCAGGSPTHQDLFS